MIKILDFSVRANPLGTPEAIKTALTAAIRDQCGAPVDPDFTALRQTIALRHGVQGGQIAVSQREEELIALLAASAGEARRALLPVPCPRSYARVLKRCGLDVKKFALPLKHNYRIPRGALAEALEALREAAASNVNVLITGETGTGKELFASALHANSLRASGPFVTVDCTTLPETLVEAHLFGHARGAFTGADRAREGLLAAADHGTLFLDEVGELPLPVQGAFLRALELRRFRPVGEVREVESDFRLVAATNRELDDMVGMDLYRSDLRFRLRGMTIHVPPLRRRAEDIPLLAEHFTARYCQRHELPNKELTPDCYAMLADYSWPGNVRELRHTIERACAAAGDGTQLFTRHLPTEIRIELARKRLVHLSEPEESAPTAPLPEQEPSTQPRKPETFPTLRDMKAKAERDYIAGLFAACQGDVRRAAGIAGVSRGHFYELLKKYGLDRTSSIPEFPAI